MDASKLKNILEAGLLVAGRTMSVAQLEALFQHDEDRPERKQIKEALESLKEDYSGRGIELVEVASGYRLQSHESVSDWVANLFQEKTPRYSRALLETLVLIAYRQPITRAEIEEVRGVAVSSNIIKTLQERHWVKILGHKEVPGRPALLGTSKEFLDYFNLKKLDDLPSLADIKDLDQFDELLAEEAGDADDQDDGANDDGDDSGDSNTDKPDGPVNGPIAANGEPANLTDINLASASVEVDESAESDSDDESVDDESTSDESTSDESTADESTGSDTSEDPDAASPSLKASSPSIWEISAKRKNAESAEADEASSVDVDASSSDEVGESDSDDDGAPEHNETLSGPELELLRVISDFSDEHQQEVDARDEIESGIVASDAEDGDIDVGDLSQRISDDRSSGDMPEPGDTLH